MKYSRRLAEHTHMHRERDDLDFFVNQAEAVALQVSKITLCQEPDAVKASS